MFELNTITFPVVSADLKLSKWFTTILDNLTQEQGNGLFKYLQFTCNIYF